MASKTEAHVRLTYRDSMRPGTITLGIAGESAQLVMSAAGAAALAGRLLEAVAATGFELSAKKASR